MCTHMQAGEEPAQGDLGARLQQEGGLTTQTVCRPAKHPVAVHGPQVDRVPRPGRRVQHSDGRGSPTLMVCVNETATLPRLTLVSRLPSMCTAARGRMDLICTRQGGTDAW